MDCGPLVQNFSVTPALKHNIVISKAGLNILRSCDNRAATKRDHRYGQGLTEDCTSLPESRRATSQPHDGSFYWTGPACEERDRAQVWGGTGPGAEGKGVTILLKICVRACIATNINILL